MVANPRLRTIILPSYTHPFRSIIIRTKLRLPRFVLAFIGLLTLFVVASKLEAQTPPTAFEATSLNSTTPGLLQLQNTAWLTRQNYFSTDLINQPPGEYLVQAFDTPTGLPNSSYLLNGAGVTLWMSQPTGTTGSLFPEFKLFLNGPTGTPVCSMTGNTALDASPFEPVTLGCTASAAVPVTPADRYYLWVGFTSSATAADSTQVELSVGNVLRGRGRTQLWVSLAAIPNINGITPSTGPVGTQVTIRGFNFGPIQGTSTAQIGNMPLDIISWSDTAILANVPQGGTTGNVVVTNGAQPSNPVSFTVTQTPGALFGRYSHTVTSVTLTSASVFDWAHWGTSTDAPLVRKQGGVLNDFSVIGTSTPSVFSDGEIEYSWTDGDVLPAVSRTKTGISITGVGNGFHLNVPADTSPKTLILYLGGWEAQGQITASLSDNSVPPFTDTPVDIVANNGDHHVNGTYSLTFQAGHPGQTLSVDYVMAADHGATSGVAGYVSLESAALVTPAQPAIFLTSPGDNQAFYSPSGPSVPVAAVASQIGAPINKVSFFSDGQKISDATTAPYAFSISGLSLGDHVITASATDANGATSYSNPKVIAGYSYTGILAGASGIEVPTDLTASTSDWIHWGGSVPDRRAGIIPQISDFNTLANGSAHSYDASAVGGVNSSWSFGTPTGSQAGTATQMRMQGFKNGFSFTVPVDTTIRILSLNIASGYGEVTLRASLSDGSGMPYVDVFSTPAAFNERNYSIVFQAGSAGQQLTITGEVTRDDGFAYVALESASVVDAFAPYIATITPATAAPGDQITITGSNFGTQSTRSVVSLNGVAMNVISWTDSAITAVVPFVRSGPIVVSSGLADSNSVNFTVILPPAPTISALSPNQGTAGTQVTITGTNFGSTQGGSQAQIGAQLLSIISWSDTAIIATIPAGSTTGDIVVFDAVQQSNGMPFTVVVTPLLSGSLSQTVTAVTLTSPLALDWEHWGATDDQPLVRMAGSQFLLSDLSVIGSNSPALFSDGEIEYLWTDGDVLTTAERTTTGISISGIGNGFHLSVPADAIPKTLMLYVGASSAQGQLTASISDNSSAPYIDSSLNAVQGNDLSGTYRIDFRATQPGQTLNIDYVVLADHGNGANLIGKVNLESAELFPHLPDIAITSPQDGQIFAYPSQVSAAVDASQIDFAIAKVDFFNDSQNLFELTTAPYSFNLVDTTPGDHVLTAIATDVNGLVATTDPVLVAEIQGGGSLSATIDVPANVDISAGTTDWVHWGNPDSANNIDRKAGIAAQISDITALANGDILVADDASRGGVNYSWSGGVPTDTQAGTTTQVFMQGYKNGFTLTIPADTTLRTAKLYVGYGFGTSKLRASLSDGSAAPWVNTFTTSDFYNEKVITLQFQAASAGQKLIISDQIIDDGGFAYVDLEAATVTDQNSPVINTVSPTSGGPGTTLTISGSNFGDSPAGTVTLSGSALTVNSWSNSTITATLTGGYSSGPIIVSQGLANSNGFPFTYLGPVITSLIPNAGPPGALVTIGGQNLGQDPVTVTFNGLQANVISQGPGAIQVTVPSTISLGAKQVVVQTSTGTTNALQFDVVLAPVITSLTPNFGINGQKVKIYGANFGLLPADSIISFGGFYATPISWSESVIQTQVPDGFLGGIVTVIVGGQTSNGIPFEVPIRCLTDCNAQRSSLDISPQNLSLVVGESADLNVVDNLGESVPFPTFTLSDSTLGTVTPGDKSSTFTAIAPGTETVTATVGSLTTSTTITIYAGPTLPDGTIKWQLPGSIVGGSAANFVQAQPAVGSATATFVEDLSDPRFNVIIRALDVNGRQLWAWPTQASYFTLFFNPVAPTPNGGFVYTDALSINAVDANGHPLWSYPFPQYRFEPLTVGYDGTVYALVNFAEAANVFQSSDTPTHLVALDAQKGTEKFRVPLPQGHFLISGTNNDGTGLTGGSYSRPIVLADGSINVASWNRDLSEILSPNSQQAIPLNNSHDPHPTGTTIWCPSDVLECWAPIDSFGNAMDKQTDVTEGQEINLLNVQPDGSYKQYQLFQSQVECLTFGEHFTYVLDDGLTLPEAHVSGVRTQSNGSSQSDGHKYAQFIGSWSQGTCGVGPSGPDGFDIMVVPNGSGGLLVASETADAPNPVWIKNISNPSVSGDGTVITIPELNTVNRIVIGENGKAFAAGSWNFFETPRLVSFNLTGGTNWTYDSPFGTPDSPGYVDIVAASPDGSLHATEGDFFDQIPEAAFTLDGRGVRTDDPTSNQSLAYIASSGIGSGTWLGANLLTTVAGISAYTGTMVFGIDSTYSTSSPSGNEQPTLKVRVHRFSDSNATIDRITTEVFAGMDFWRKNAGILMTWKPQQILVENPCSDMSNCWQFIPGAQVIFNPDNLSFVQNRDDVTIVPPDKSNALYYWKMTKNYRARFPDKTGIDVFFVNSLVPVVTNGAVATALFDAQSTFNNKSFGLFKTVANQILYSPNANQVMPHEMGHTLQLFHVQSLRNLMCGGDAFFITVFGCPDPPSPTLQWWQIRDAKAAAGKLVDHSSPQ